MWTIKCLVNFASKVIGRWIISWILEWLADFWLTSGWLLAGAPAVCCYCNAIECSMWWWRLPCWYWLILGNPITTLLPCFPALSNRCQSTSCAHYGCQDAVEHVAVAMQMMHQWSARIVSVKIMYLVLDSCLFLTYCHSDFPVQSSIISLPFSLFNGSIYTLRQWLNTLQQGLSGNC